MRRGNGAGAGGTVVTVTIDEMYRVFVLAGTTVTHFLATVGELRLFITTDQDVGLRIGGDTMHLSAGACLQMEGVVTDGEIELHAGERDAEVNMNVFYGHEPSAVDHLADLAR